VGVIMQITIDLELTEALVSFSDKDFSLVRLNFLNQFVLSYHILLPK
jgi:hypothetical protein